MASLANILSTRLANAPRDDIGDSQLEQGKVYFYTPGGIFSNFFQNMCWRSPGFGTAVVEIWGASGSGSRQCCCSGGTLPGNPGGYARKTIQVTPDSRIFGITGYSCGNADGFCFRGCSQSTCITICLGGAGTCSCMCARGGHGGYAMCSTSTAPYCCLVAQGFSHSALGGNCGIVCNNAGPNGSTGAPGWGGDVNIPGGISCTSFFFNSPNNYCCAQYHIAVSPGIIGECGALITHNGEYDVIWGCVQGNQSFAQNAALNAAGRNPGRGGSFVMGCWNGFRGCGCYESHGCMPYVPVGVGGSAIQPTAGIRDHGGRGGHGAVRIKYIGS